MYLNVSIPKMQIRDKAIVVYQQPQTDGSKHLQLFRRFNMQAQQKRAYSGRLTAGAKKRLTKAVILLCKKYPRKWQFNQVTQRTQLHQLSFLTLTVSDTGEKLDGKEAYKLLLSKFLGWLRKYKGVESYIWKAELQKNGQLHYHITFPNIIHFREIRDKWNELQSKAGIIAKYRERQLAFHANGFQVRKDLLAWWSLEKQKTAYAKGMQTDWQDPNSIDIHTVYKIKDMPAYLVKELAKGMQNSVSIGGKTWDCSADLSKGKLFTMTMEERHYLFCETAVNEGLADSFHSERFSIYRFKADEPIEEYLLSKEDLRHYKTWLRVLRKEPDPEPQCTGNNSTNARVIIQERSQVKPPMQLKVF